MWGWWEGWGCRTWGFRCRPSALRLRICSDLLNLGRWRTRCMCTTPAPLGQRIHKGSLMRLFPLLCSSRVVVHIRPAHIQQVFPKQTLVGHCNLCKLGRGSVLVLNKSCPPITLHVDSLHVAPLTELRAESFLHVRVWWQASDVEGSLRFRVLFKRAHPTPIISFCSEAFSSKAVARGWKLCCKLSLWEAVKVATILPQCASTLSKLEADPGLWIGDTLCPPRIGFDRAAGVALLSWCRAPVMLVVPDVVCSAGWLFLGVELRRTFALLDLPSCRPHSSSSPRGICGHSDAHGGDPSSGCQELWCKD
eukprot:m.461513 g.461513  ORF g.461513 m.461513 type:complete len:307 (-) comp22333_c0_seq1:355-1275(-)